MKTRYRTGVLVFYQTTVEVFKAAKKVNQVIKRVKVIDLYELLPTVKKKCFFLHFR